MGISKLLDAVHQLNSNESNESRLQKLIRQKNILNESRQEIIPSTSQQSIFENKNSVLNKQESGSLSQSLESYNLKTNSYDQKSILYNQQSKLFKNQLSSYEQQSLNRQKNQNFETKDDNEFISNKISLKEKINEKTFKSFDYSKVSIKKVNENSKIEKNFNKTNHNINDRLMNTYSWKNKVYEIVTGKQQKNQLTYQNEYDFFTKKSETNMSNNEMFFKNRNYFNNKNLYYLTNDVIDFISKKDIKEELKNFLKENKNFILSNRFLQRILIELNENLDDKYLNLFLNFKNQKNFDLITNIKDEFLIENKDSIKKLSINESFKVEKSFQNELSQVDFYTIKSIKISFLNYKNIITENILVSQLLYNLEKIFYIDENQLVVKLTEKIKKLKELVDSIKNCYQEYTKSSNNDNQIEKFANNILTNYIIFLKILFDERDKYIIDYRLRLFKILKLWKDIQTIRQKNGSLTKFNLKFKENLNQDDNYQFNSMIENRLIIEENYYLINQSLKNEQNLNLFIDNQLNQNIKNELLNNLKKKTYLLDGRLPGEPKFYDFQVSYNNIIENLESTNDNSNNMDGVFNSEDDNSRKDNSKDNNSKDNNFKDNNSKDNNFKDDDSEDDNLKDDILKSNTKNENNELLDDNLKKQSFDTKSLNKNSNEKAFNESSDSLLKAKSIVNETENKNLEIKNNLKKDKKIKNEKTKESLTNKEFLIKIYQDKEIIFETQKMKPDYNLQICFNDISINKIIYYDKPIIFNFFKLKNNKPKLINEFFIDINDIFFNSLLHNNLNLNIQNEFMNNKLKYVFNLSLIKQDKNKIDLEIFQKSIHSNLIKNSLIFNDNIKSKLNLKTESKLKKFYSDNNLRLNLENKFKSNSILENSNSILENSNSILENSNSILENSNLEKSLENKFYSEKNLESINTLETSLESIDNSINNLKSTNNSETNSEVSLRKNLNSINTIISNLNSIENLEIKNIKKNFTENINSSNLESIFDLNSINNLIILIFKIDNKVVNFKNLNDFSNKLQFIIKMIEELEKQIDLSKFLNLIKQSYEKIDKKNIFNQNCEPIQLNQRLYLLKQRNDLNEEFDLIKQRIPLHDSQYLSFLIKDEKYLKKQETNKFNLKDTNLNIDLLKNYDEKYKNAINFLINSRIKLINHTNSWNKSSKNYEDFVYEEIDTSLTTLNFNFLFLNQKIKRPLKPNRKERKNFQSLQQSNKNQNFNNQVINEKVKIMVNIKQGFNIPTRKIPKQQFKEAESSNKPNEFLEETLSINSLESVISKNLTLDLLSNDQKVSPFFEIKFQDQVLFTSVNEGNQPSWNESFKLNLNVPNDDYAPNNLLKINDFIYLNLYDQIDKKDSNTKNWLGSIKIPFLSLYLNSKIEGSFLLNKPYHSTYYDFNVKQKISFLNQQNKENNQENKMTSLIKLFLTIDPQLNLPTKIEFKCNTNEELGVFNYAKDWQFQLNKNLNRNIKSMVINLVNGKQTIVTRYLNPIEPPLEIINQNLDLKSNMGDNFKKSYKSILMQNIARFVSLIPFLKNELLTVGLMEDVWSDCDQFLKINIGSIEEHAILLCNYFLYLSLNCGLVLGSGVPEGKTCYVIVWLNEMNKSTNDLYLKVQLWNPITGACYHTSSDNFFTLSKVDSIITKDNVYANIQKSDLINQINFNIHKTNYWKPLFSNKQKLNLSTIQPFRISYETINDNYVKSLEQQIEIYLKESLMNWRVQKKTFFNRFCQKEIKKELGKMEYKVCNFIELDPVEEINKVLSTNKNYGLLLNSPFTGISDLVELLYSTNIHSNLDDKIDFVISLHLHPYPNNVYSTWIYCAIISRN